MTFLLLVIGTLAIAAFEWNASFAGMPVADKWTQAFFNATCPRTAGFSSVDLASLSVQTLLVYLVLMWIGGGAQSTAGGVKSECLCGSCSQSRSCVAWYGACRGVW